MMPLETAQQRLERAVDRLERLAAYGQFKAGDSDGRLKETLEAVRADYRALREVTQTVRSQLDATIARLENVLER